MPFDYTSPIVLEMAALALVITTFYNVLLGVAVASLPVFTVVLTWAQIQVLNSKLRSIRPENIISEVVPDKPGVRKIRHVDPLVGIMVDEETDGKLVHGEAYWSARRAIIRRKQQILLEKKKREGNIKMERKLIECVKLHQALLSLVSEAQSYSEYPLLGAVGGYLLESCLTAFIIVQAGTLTFSDFLQFGVHLLCVSSGIFTICFLSELLNKEFTGVGEAVYDCEWFASSDSFKRSMRIIISRANQDHYLITAGFISFSMDMFNGLTNTSYSYYTSLMSLHS